MGYNNGVCGPGDSCASFKDKGNVRVKRAIQKVANSFKRNTPMPKKKMTQSNAMHDNPRFMNAGKKNSNGF